MENNAIAKQSEKSSNVIYNLKEFFSNPKIKYSVLAVFLLIISFSVQYFLNRPSFGIFWAPIWILPTMFTFWE